MSIVNDCNGTADNDSVATITIKLDTYRQLKADSRFLHALEAAGVDNWEGYSDAHDLME